MDVHVHEHMRILVENMFQGQLQDQEIARP